MFKFRFATLLKVRRINEERALQAFAAAQRYKQELMRQRDQNRTTILAKEESLVQRLQDGMLAREAADVQNYCDILRVEILHLETQIMQSENEVERTRQVLLKAKQEVQAMERLEEIERERYNDEQRKLEMNFINEIAITRHGKSI